MNPLTATAAVNGASSAPRNAPLVTSPRADGVGGRISHAEQLARYAWAARFTRGLVVLDVGCGFGYGTQVLAHAGAERVVGVDVSAEAVSHANVAGPGIEVARGDITGLPFPDATFGAVVCLDVLERVADPEGAVSELRRVLLPQGLALFSISNPLASPSSARNDERGLTVEAFEQLLARSFLSLRLERQDLMAASLIADHETHAVSDPSLAGEAEIRTLSPGRPGMEPFSLAIASDGPLPAAEPLVTMVDTFEVQLWQERIDELREELRAARHELEASKAREATADLGKRRMALALEELSAQNARLHDLETERALVDRECAELVTRAHVAEFWLIELQNSASWRITRPLRVAMMLGRRVVRRPSPAQLRAPQ